MAVRLDGHLGGGDLHLRRLHMHERGGHRDIRGCHVYDRCGSGNSRRINFDRSFGNGNWYVNIRLGRRWNVHRDVLRLPLLGHLRPLSVSLHPFLVGAQQLGFRIRPAPLRFYLICFPVFIALLRHLGPTQKVAEVVLQVQIREQPCAGP